MAKPIRVLLYYLYTPIENAEQFAADHLAFCKSIGLKGRILVADEGINGTVSGDYETTQKYMDYVHSLPGMEDLWFKIDEEEEQAFKKMFVRYKKEIVHLGLEDDNFDNDINPLETRGATCLQKSLKKLFSTRIPLFLILETTTSTTLDTSVALFVLTSAISVNCHNGSVITRKNSWTSVLSSTVLVESGEKFSGWMVREGYKDVGQLHGGIATYGKDPEVQGELWDGKMYVFDERIAVDVNHVDPSVVGKRLV